jgi:hypothetical protein
MAQATYVNGLYLTLLNRPADAVGLVGWVVQLHDGVARSQIVSGIWNSGEHRGIEVDMFYATFLHRSADPAGRAGWTNALLSGESEVDVARAFIDSGEYQAAHADNTSFVIGLYGDVLGRAPGAPEVTNWVQILQGGTGRDAVAEAFLTSREAYLRMLNGDYNMFLHRPPDAAGEKGWLSLLQSNALSPMAVSQAFLASDEFYAMAVQASHH